MGQCVDVFKVEPHVIQWEKHLIKPTYMSVFKVDSSISYKMSSPPIQKVMYTKVNSLDNIITSSSHMCIVSAHNQMWWYNYVLSQYIQWFNETMVWNSWKSIVFPSTFPTTHWCSWWNLFHLQIPSFFLRLNKWYILNIWHFKFISFFEKLQRMTSKGSHLFCVNPEFKTDLNNANKKTWWATLDSTDSGNDLRMNF